MQNDVDLPWDIEEKGVMSRLNFPKAPPLLEY
jgi:hypothetical protein